MSRARLEHVDRICARWQKRYRRKGMNIKREAPINVEISDLEIVGRKAKARTASRTIDHRVRGTS
jgi:hypothetical protein